MEQLSSQLFLCLDKTVLSMDDVVNAWKRLAPVCPRRYHEQMHTLEHHAQFHMQQLMLMLICPSRQPDANGYFQGIRRHMLRVFALFEEWRRLIGRCGAVMRTREYRDLVDRFARLREVSSVPHLVEKLKNAVVKTSQDDHRGEILRPEGETCQG